MHLCIYTCKHYSFLTSAHLLIAVLARRLSLDPQAELVFS